MYGHISMLYIFLFFYFCSQDCYHPVPHNLLSSIFLYIYILIISHNRNMTCAIPQSGHAPLYSWYQPNNQPFLQKVSHASMTQPFPLVTFVRRRINGTKLFNVESACSKTFSRMKFSSKHGVISDSESELELSSQRGT